MIIEVEGLHLLLRFSSKTEVIKFSGVFFKVSINILVIFDRNFEFTEQFFLELLIY